MEIIYTLDSPEIQALSAADARLAVVIKHYGNLTYSLHADAFTFFVETIIGQMLSSKAATAITSRLYNLCGSTLTSEVILKLDVSALRNIGLSTNKAVSILGLATLMERDPQFFCKLANLPDNEIISQISALRGLGPWSAKMYLIFVLNRLNVLPYEDSAFLQAYKWLYATEYLTPNAIKQQCEPWVPYSSLAARYLYKALDFGLIKNREINEKLYQIVN